MKVWVDAQLPPDLCGWLKSQFGVEAAHVQDVGLRDADDDVVFRFLRQPEQVVLTKDEDFVDIVTRLSPPPQIIWLRVGNCDNQSLRRFLQGVFAEALAAIRGGDAVVELKRRHPPS